MRKTSGKGKRKKFHKIKKIQKGMEKKTSPIIKPSLGIVKRIRKIPSSGFVERIRKMFGR